MKKITPLILASLFIIIVLSTLWAIPAKPVLAAGEDGTRDTITPTLTTYTGTARTLSAVSGDGNRFYNNGDTFLEVYNGYTATISATIVGRLSPTNSVTTAITAGSTYIFGPFNIRRFSQISAGNKNYVFINWDTNVTATVASSVTAAAFKLR